MKKLNITQLIDYYYDIYTQFDNNDEMLIHTIFIIMNRNNRRIGKQIIRRDLNNLHLSKYSSVLVELAGYPKSKLSDFKMDYKMDLKHIINTLQNFDIEDNLCNNDLQTIINLCKRLSINE